MKGMIVTWTGGEDRWEDDTTEFTIGNDNDLQITTRADVEITEDSISDLSPMERMAYCNRMGEVESTRVIQAVYAPGSWHRVRVVRGTEEEA